ncbi:MAG: heme exporter protein CcmB [Pseudomonadota bacterium]
MIGAVFLRDLRLGGAGFIGLTFFLALVTIIPFGVGPDLNLLARIGPAVLWIGALLSILLGLDRLFRADYEDGSLDLLLASGHAIEGVVLAKVAAYWVTTTLPLIAAVPFFGFFLNLEPVAIGALVVTMAVGTPGLAFAGAIGAAVTVSLPRGGLLLAVIILPICIPILIFGVTATRAAFTDPDPFLPPFLILIALTLFGAVVGLFASAAALRTATR